MTLHRCQICVRCCLCWSSRLLGFRECKALCHIDGTEMPRYQMPWYQRLMPVIFGTGRQPSLLSVPQCVPPHLVSAYHPRICYTCSNSLYPSNHAVFPLRNSCLSLIPREGKPAPFCPNLSEPQAGVSSAWHSSPQLSHHHCLATSTPMPHSSRVSARIIPLPPIHPPHTHILPTPRLNTTANTQPPCVSLHLFSLGGKDRTNGAAYVITGEKAWKMELGGLKTG